MKTSRKDAKAQRFTKTETLHQARCWQKSCPNGLRRSAVQASPKGLGRPGNEPLMRNPRGRDDMRSVPTGHTASNNLFDVAGSTPAAWPDKRDGAGGLTAGLKVPASGNLNFQSVDSEGLSRAGEAALVRRGSGAASLNHRVPGQHRKLSGNGVLPPRRRNVKQCGTIL